MQYVEKSCIMVDRDRPERACATRDPAEKTPEGEAELMLFAQLVETEADRDKLTWIYENDLDAMLYTARKYVGAYQAEEDVVHDAILKIIDNLAHIDPEEAAKTRNYVCVIVRCCAIDWLRKRKKYEEAEFDAAADALESTEPSPVDALLTKEGYDRLVRCIRALPDNYRTVCELKYLHGCKEREIAEILHITPKNVSVRAVRAKKKLVKMLTEGDSQDE